MALRRNAIFDVVPARRIGWNAIRNPPTYMRMVSPPCDDVNELSGEKLLRKPANNKTLVSANELKFIE